MVLENDPDESLVEEKHGEREKRKIGIIKLGVTNGIINFVFGVSRWWMNRYLINIIHESLIIICIIFTETWCIFRCKNQSNWCIGSIE